jgi:phosphate transport system substrate-binding protein
MPRDLRVSITNAPGRNVYPIASFTWLLVYERPGDRQRSRLMAEFVGWALGEGQALAPSLGYAPLPPSIVALVRETLARIRT